METPNINPLVLLYAAIHRSMMEDLSGLSTEIESDIDKRGVIFDASKKLWGMIREDNLVAEVNALLKEI